MREILNNTFVTLGIVAIISLFLWAGLKLSPNWGVTPLASAQTNATPPLYWSNWSKIASSSTSDFTTTATSNIYDASNQPNLTIAVYTSTGVTAYTVVVETAPFAITGANWSQVTTIDFTDDGSVASPKWQQVNIPGRYGKVRVRVTAITPGAGTLQVWMAT